MKPMRIVFLLSLLLLLLLSTGLAAPSQTAAPRSAASSDSVTSVRKADPKKCCSLSRSP